MSEPDKQIGPVLVPKDAFVPATSVTDKGITYLVPLDGDSNRAASRLMGVKLRAFVMEQIEMHTGTGKGYANGKKKLMNPANIKMLVDAASKAEDISRFAYAPEIHPGDLNNVNQAVQSMAKGMMQGIQDKMGGTSPKDERRNKMKSLGAAKNVTPDPIKPKEDEWT